MTTASEQMIADLNYILALEEIAESASLVRKTGGTESGRMSINLIGDTETDVPNRVVRVCLVILPKETFAVKPQPHDTITRADSSSWIIDSLTGETPVSWTVRAYAEVRVK